MAFSYYNPYPQPVQDQLAQLRGPYSQPIPTMPTQQPTSSGLLWVQGEMAAKSYLVTPNTTVLLMDSEAPRFYLKSVDMAGMPTMKTFEYKELTVAPAVSQVNTEPPVSRSEFQQLKDAVARLEAMRVVHPPEVIADGGENNE